jgi:hypothetical protein
LIITVSLFHTDALLTSWIVLAVLAAVAAFRLNADQEAVALPADPVRYGIEYAAIYRLPESTEEKQRL